MAEASDTELAQARDPCTPPPQLRTLARLYPALRPAIAANPNIPVDLLMELAQHHPAECLRNPLLPMALLEDPSLLARASHSLLYRLAVSAPSDPTIVRALFDGFTAGSGKEFPRDHRSYGVALLFLNNPATPGDLLERIGADQLDRDATLAAHPGVTPQLLRSLLASDEHEARRHAARHPRAADDLLPLLRRCGVCDDMLLPDLPLGALSESEFCDLAEAGPFTWKLAARHPAVAPEALERLGRSPSLKVCGAVAAKPSSPAVTLQQAIDETEIFFRYWRSNRVGPSAPWKQALDPRIYLRLGLALRPDAPPRMLRLLVGDPEPLIWRSLAELPDLSIDLRLDLLRAHPFELTAPTLTSPASPAPLLAQLAQHDQQRIRQLSIDELRLLASHPRTPDEVLAWLARAWDDDPHVRQIIARRRTKTPPPSPPTPAPPPPDPAPAPAQPRASGLGSLRAWLAGLWRR